jgi:periplasmic protein CpxP/Spy
MTGMKVRGRRATRAAMSALMVLVVSTALATGIATVARAGDVSAGPLVADAAPAPQAGGGPAKADKPMKHLEATIAKLHKELLITADQEPQFKAYADVMRGNAQAMRDLFEEQGKIPDHTAVTHLRWYAQLTAAHAEGLNKLVPVFEALYQSLSDKQKGIANKVFDEFGVRRPPHRRGKE